MKGPAAVGSLVATSILATSILSAAIAMPAASRLGPAPGSARSLTAAIVAAEQPTQPTSGPGSNGPCGLAVRSFPTPRWSSEKTYVYQPTGGAKAPTGGACDARKRPTVLLAHGTNESDQATFEGLVTHLVSNGNIVVYPTHTMESNDPKSNDDAYHAVLDGFVAAVASTPRIDARRLGVWGHSFGGGMTPYLVQQIADRGWGRRALWMSIVAQAYTRLATTKGTRAIKVPRWTREMTVSMEDDELADNRLGIDVYESLTLPFPHKLYVRLNTDTHGQPPIVADHTAPAGSASTANVDALDYALWRYADVLESCALFRRGCGPDLPSLGSWSDGTPVVPALVAYHPVDTGPAPALLAECDGLYGPVLNADRMPYCGPTHR